MVDPSPPAPSEIGGPQGSLSTALSHAAKLLIAQPRHAQAQCVEILRVAPGHPQATLMLGAALRRTGEAVQARQVLKNLVAAQPRWAEAQFQLGLVFSQLDEAALAKATFEAAVALKPDLPDAWRELGDLATVAGDRQAADRAYAQNLRYSSANPQLIDAGGALHDGRLDVAEHLLRAHLQRYPSEVAALRMLAELGTRLGRYEDAERILSGCLDLAPSFEAARHNYAVVLFRQNKPSEALAQLERLLAQDPANPSYRNLKAATLATLGEYEHSIDTYAAVLAEYPRQPKAWLSYGHALKTAGRQDESIEAYRRCVALEPGFGEAYWSLANLKTWRFTTEDIAAMQKQLARLDLGDDDRLHLNYALGKALEDAQVYETSFANYAAGAAIRRRQQPWDAQEFTARTADTMGVFTPALLSRQSELGDLAPDPIFVVGLPRSGSTLIEQILSSHSAVEGTMELPDISNLAKALNQDDGDGIAYPELLADLDAATLQGLGRKYINDTRVQRKSAKPFFIDKMPNNFLHLGLIHLILPNAKIIDARRHPLAVGFSSFKQHFARGQRFSYGLEDIGLYYRDYVALMAHFDAVLPGRVHRVIYEDMVDDTEAEIRRLLDYCRLDFEPSCLRFYENDRAVRTASSEQVRRPIFRDGVDQWRHFEPWLEPLKAALGPLVDDYRG